MPPLFLLTGQDIPLNDGGVFFDTDIALVLGGPGPGVCFVGQEQPQTFAFLHDGPEWAQNVEDDHVPGIVLETLHSKLVLAGDYSVVFHRQAVLSFRFRAAKKPGRVNLSGVPSFFGYLSWFRCRCFSHWSRSLKMVSSIRSGE